MTQPVECGSIPIINPRLVTKTSLPDAKQAIALSYLLWVASGRPSSVEYGIPSGEKLELDEYHVKRINDLAISTFGEAAPGYREIQEWLDSNKLLSSQIEALNMGFELIWHLGSFSFLSPSISERQGKKRYRKIIRFSANMDILDSLSIPGQCSVEQVMFSWFSSGKVHCNASLERSLVRVLTVFSETSFYKTKKGDDATTYATTGVYSSLLDGSEIVELVYPLSEETQGPTRILNTAIKTGLNYYLTTTQAKTATLSKDVSIEELGSYRDRALTSLSLSRIETEPKAETEETIMPIEYAELDGVPKNLICFGAPGTGKSYNLNKEAKGVFPKSAIRRVTFHPDYTYAQFVGCYKPVSVEKPGQEDIPAAQREFQISYDFEPGPFLETYKDAIRNPNQSYLLLVEEINRANPAAVFGDVFQLLDRDDTGISQYPVVVSKDVRQWMEVRLSEGASTVCTPENPVSDYDRLQDIAKKGELVIPPNMYIWATMNSADQGVFPMDTAFKRRWDFRYLGIDEGEDIIEGKKVPVAKTNGMTWNSLRKGINELLLTSNVNEDKLIGPFFIKPSVLDDPDFFTEVFCSKVLLYLYEDAARMSRKKIFGDKPYSKVREMFIKEGLTVFNGYEKIKSWSAAVDQEVFDEGQD